jgi:hypothetical protein
MSRNIADTPGLRIGGVFLFRLVALGRVDGEFGEDLAAALLEGG